MRLVIHAGIHRTGTTTLQRFLASSRDALKDQGFLYPFETISHKKISWLLHNDRLTGRTLRDQLLNETSADTRTIILSHEDFARLKPLAWLKPLKAEFDVQAVFYLRRQDFWLMSWYNQHVKWPFNRRKSLLSASEFLETIEDYYWLDYYWLVSHWAKHLGRENVLVGVLEKAQVTDVVTDFCERVGLDRTRLKRVEANSNESLPPHLLEFARLLQIIDIPEGRRSKVIEGLRKLEGGSNATAAAIYSPDERNAILARFAKSNAALARDFLNRPDGKLFFDNEVPPNAPFMRPSLPDSYELVEKYVRPLIHHLTEVEAKQERARGRWLRRGKAQRD
jgi:hypothetical protein